MRLCSKVKGTSTGSVTGIKPWTRYSHVVMTSTQGSVVPSQVRVRAARWDASRKSFAFTSEGEAPVTITWQTMRAAYADQDTSRPASVGYLRIPEVPLIEKFPALRDVLFDDYIVVFPEGSGMSPLYLMFRDRREL
ncbi:S-type pyocin domain-containing protein [Enterobacterales bacterium BD_CKDN230030183-1A_HGKHYDSX7]